MTNRLVPHDAPATIAAGGIVFEGAKLPADERTSTIRARAYRLPPAEDRGPKTEDLVIRLEPDAVALGADAEMAALGFESANVSKPLGVVRYRTLGFPAWALVHQPAKAKIALGFADDMRQAKRLLPARPGPARDAFEAIAKVLGKAAPQFLPSFWEEAGRAVAEASPTMAAQFFEKARSTERAYKLKTDAEDADAVFLEFALLGALSAKTLGQYAKDLAKSAGTAEAYRRFRAIAVKRTLGGMPPWAGMGKDLRALAVAAKLDADREDDAFLAEILEAPAIAKAPAELWTTYAGSLARLASRADVRARLRMVWPEPKGGTDEARAKFHAAWIERLVELGAVADLPDAGLGAWVSRLVRYAGASPRVITLLHELAPRLADQPISVSVPWGWYGESLHLDLAELALSLGIPLADPKPDDTFDPSHITCDPVRVAVEPRYAPILVATVAQMLGEDEHEAKLRGKSGFDVARRAWIERRIARLGGPLADAELALDELDNYTTAEAFLAFPDVLAVLAATTMAPSLAATLRGGIVDEFGWPAYEEAFASFAGSAVRVSGLFPTVVLMDVARAVAVGATGVVMEHDLVYKKDKKPQSAFYLCGEMLVGLALAKGWGDEVAYWSSAPKTHVPWEAGVITWQGAPVNSVTLPDGRVTMGGKAFRAGDPPTPRAGFVFDGTTAWTPDTPTTMRELEVGSGKPGAPGLPAFFQGYGTAGKPLQTHNSVILPLPDGLASSPLGSKGGLVGMRVRGVNDHWEAERIDGPTFAGDFVPFGLVTFPGGDARPRAISIATATTASGEDVAGVTLFDPSGAISADLNAQAWASRGWGDVLVPPAEFWDFLTPRDEAGSRALRAVTDGDAARLLGGATLAGIANGKLAAGVAGVVEHARALQARLVELAEARSASNADDASANLSPQGQRIRKLARALAGGKAAKIADLDVDLRPWIQHGRALAVKSLSVVAEDRRTARDLVGALAGTMLADDVGMLRLLTIAEPDDWTDPESWNTVVVREGGGSWFAINGSSSWAIERSTDGQFRVPEPYTLDAEVRPKRGIGTEWARGFLALPEAMPWEPGIATALAAASGLSEAEATLLYLGAPEGDSYKKDFLGKKRRELVGLKLNDADTARQTFAQLDDGVVDAILERAVPDDPAMLMTPLAPGGYVERLGAAWKAKMGKRPKVPQELVAALKKDVGIADELKTFTPALFGEVEDAWYLRPNERPIAAHGTYQDEGGLHAEIAATLATLLAWLAYARPIGDVMRAGVAPVIARLQEVLADPRTLWVLETMYVRETDAASAKRRAAFLDLVGGQVIAQPAWQGVKCIEARDNGATRVALYVPYAIGAIHTAVVGDARARAKMEALARALYDEEDAVLPFDHAIRLAEMLSGDGFGELARLDKPDGAYEANPAVSAPKLVAKVAKACKLSEEAAALYLQVLALAEPTEAAVKMFNGWDGKRYKAAAAELVAKKVVREGKRERAGRSIFLAGGYDKGEGKNLPMEDWKAQLYGVLDRHLPTEPCGRLFARAWKRIEDGDKPG